MRQAPRVLAEAGLPTARPAQLHIDTCTAQDNRAVALAAQLDGERARPGRLDKGRCRRRRCVRPDPIRSEAAGAVDGEGEISIASPSQRRNATVFSVEASTW